MVATDSKKLKQLGFRPITLSGTNVTAGSLTILAGSSENFASPRIGLSSDGTKATALWRADLAGVTGGGEIRSASAEIAAGKASFGSVAILSASGFLAYSPHLALSADGSKATAWWLRRVSGLSMLRTRSATIQGKSATWGPATRLSDESTKVADFSGDLSDDGTIAAVTWSDQTPGKSVLNSMAATIIGERAKWSAVPKPAASAAGTSFVFADTKLQLVGSGAKVCAAYARFVPRSPPVYLESIAGSVQGNDIAWGLPHNLGNQSNNSTAASLGISADGETTVASWSESTTSETTVQASAGIIVHPTPTPTPLATNTPTPTPTPVATATPVGVVSNLAPTLTHRSHDGELVLRIKDYPNRFVRDYYGYVLKADTHKRVAAGKFRIHKLKGRLVFHVDPGEYIIFTVIRRSKAPQLVSSRYRKIEVY